MTVFNSHREAHLEKRTSEEEQEQQKAQEQGQSHIQSLKVMSSTERLFLSRHWRTDLWIESNFLDYLIKVWGEVL